MGGMISMGVEEITIGLVRGNPFERHVSTGEHPLDACGQIQVLGRPAPPGHDVHRVLGIDADFQGHARIRRVEQFCHCGELADVVRGIPQEPGFTSAGTTLGVPQHPRPPRWSGIGLS
nr:hypothetical protein [Saccharopolyspora sp. S2-29]